MNKIFFDDPMVLFKKEEVFKIWPDSKKDITDRINSSARFIIFVSCALYLYTRDTRIFVVGLMCLGSLYFILNTPAVKYTTAAAPGATCQRPTVDNPMGNFLQSDWNRKRLPVCEYSTVKPAVESLLTDSFIPGNSRSRSAHPDHQKYAASRQWVMTPARDNPSSQTEFAEFLYGKRSQPTCRDDPSSCDPNFRGVQSEAFGGVDAGGLSRFHGGSF